MLTQKSGKIGETWRKNFNNLKNMTEQPMQPKPVTELADQEVSDADYKRFVPVFLANAKNLVDENDPNCPVNFQMLRANMVWIREGGKSIPRQFAESIERKMIADGIIKKKEGRMYEVLNWEPKI